MPDGIIVTNRQGIVQFINPAAESFFGRKSEDFKGKQFGFPITSGDKTEIDIIRKPGDIVSRRNAHGRNGVVRQICPPHIAA